MPELRFKYTMINFINVFRYDNVSFCRNAPINIIRATTIRLLHDNIKSNLVFCYYGRSYIRDEQGGDFADPEAGCQYRGQHLTLNSAARRSVMDTR